MQVSIHTPPWGRDAQALQGRITLCVSIHTPPWGRDNAIMEKITVIAFQFTRPRGGAMYLDAYIALAYAVSIHTPPWGRDGSDVGNNGVYVFQFTRPRGGAIPDGTLRYIQQSFNSHAPVGAR